MYSISGLYGSALFVSNFIKVGISYDMCIFPEIPYDEHDVLMDYVLTGDNLYE